MAEFQPTDGAATAPVVPPEQLASLLREWFETGATLIEALQSPPAVVRAFTQLQLRLMGK